VLVSLLGWSEGKILTATFEVIPLMGCLPNLPGDPSGDAIEYHNTIQPRLKVQNSSISGSKAAEFHFQPYQQSTNFIGPMAKLQRYWD
jgi:hypothetical protein